MSRASERRQWSANAMSAKNTKRSINGSSSRPECLSVGVLRWSRLRGIEPLDLHAAYEPTTTGVTRRDVHSLATSGRWLAHDSTVRSLVSIGALSSHRYAHPQC